jgi:hypothetical protein
MELEKWIAIITSAISIGYALPYITKFVQFAAGFLFRKELLEGTWHAYHFTRMRDEIILRHEKWTIKRDPLNRLIIETQDPKNPDLKYKGFISTERNYLLILLKGVRHKEEVQMRFFDIIPTGQDMVFGLLMGVDFDNRPECLVRIMGRKELTDEEAKELLRHKTIVREPGILSISA